MILRARDAVDDEGRGSRPTAPDGPLSLSLAWLQAPSLWFRKRHDVLGRVYQVALVARAMLAAEAIFTNLVIILPVARAQWAIWATSAFIVAWTALISWVMVRPSRRRGWTFVADAVVTCLVVLATPFAIGPTTIDDSLAGYWIVGAAIYAAIFWSTWGGVLSALAASAVLILMPGDFTWDRVGLSFVAVLLAASVGVLISQFRSTIVEQEQERIKAAALAERERLSRIVHDGALQVLALVEREGAALGPMGQRLAALARESEAQLRVHLQDREVADLSRRAQVDLTSALDKYSSARVTVSTMAGEVLASRFIVEEIEATLTEILKNVERHAGDDAHAWVLLDQEVDDEVILWVRDNGEGMDAAQARRATEQGRFGIRDSIIGRISAVGGSAILKSAPGAGTEWELRIPTDVE